MAAPTPGFAWRARSQSVHLSDGVVRYAGACAISLATVSNSFLATLADRILVADGAMGTMLQAADLDLDDFQGLEGCNEILNVTRPDVVRGVHEAYLAAGADCVETNTFGANLGNLGDYDIQHRIRELSEAGAAARPRGGRRVQRPPSSPGSCSARSVPAPSCPPSGHALRHAA
jgi:5-methyltetrahydrofolate--homocysteine methyltransferase